jgi:hypothetical protein
LLPPYSKSIGYAKEIDGWRPSKFLEIRTPSSPLSEQTPTGAIIGL